jgi:hypothetical protein
VDCAGCKGWEKVDYVYKMASPKSTCYEGVKIANICGSCGKKAIPLFVVIILAFVALGTIILLWQINVDKVSYVCYN